MPTRSAICASSGEYTPPVNRYGSVRSRSRNAFPGLCMGPPGRSVQLERGGGPDRGGLQQRGGAGPAVGERLDGNGAFGTAGRAAIEASEVVHVGPVVRTATALGDGVHDVSSVPLADDWNVSALTVPPGRGRPQPQ